MTTTKRTPYHYTVVVGNVGTVYHGQSRSKAVKAFESYTLMSKHGVGRAAGEAVTMMFEDDVLREHPGVDREGGDL